MDGFVMRRRHGSIQSPGTGDVSSAFQMKFFQTALISMEYTTMNLRVRVPDQNMDLSAFHGADQMLAKRTMADEINARLGTLLRSKITPQLVRKGALQAHPAVAIFTAEVTVANKSTIGNVNFQQAMKVLTASGGSMRTLTKDMVDRWATLEVAEGIGAPPAPHMTFTLEPKPNANMENIAHSVELTPQQLIDQVQELHRRAEAGSPLRNLTLEELKGCVAIYSSYVAGNAGPTTTIFCLQPHLLTSVIDRIGTLGLMQGSWINLMVAVPIRVIGNGTIAGQLGQDPPIHEEGLAPAFTLEERSFGHLESCWRYPPYDRAICTPAYSLSMLWCGKNGMDVCMTLAFMLSEHCSTMADMLPATLTTLEGWIDRVHVATNRNGDIMRVMIAAVPGPSTMAIFDALQDKELACSPNGERVRLAFGPGKCMACRPARCFKCDGNNHGPLDCPNNVLTYMQKIIPCTICRKPTGGHHSHRMETCDAHLQINNPARLSGCPICLHRGHQATQCPVWKDRRGVPHVPALLGVVFASFPDWQIVGPAATSGSVSSGKAAWYNTFPIAVTPMRMSFGDALRTPMSSPGTSTSDSEASGNRMERWNGRGGGTEDLMELAKTLHAKLDAVGTSVNEIRQEQNLQTKGMELLHASTAAQTKAISTLQASEAKHAAFFAKLQKAHDDAMALNESLTSEGMDEDEGGSEVPSKDSMTATRQ